MEYFSTRGGTAISAGAAILKGIANDGGLYVPSSFPIIDKEDMADMLKMEYYERAALILSKFLTDYDEEELIEYCRRAYSRFDGEPAPIVSVDENTYILELFHGPTLAFKDIALTLLPHLMTAARLRQNSTDKTLILVATSGDTGKAALEGFSEVSGTEIICVYPSEGVSAMQKLQMQTTKGDNVHVIGIDGNFDDAQAAVKKIFNDPDAIQKLSELGYSMSSANSINWGRLAPQIVYYFSAYLDLVGSEEIEDGEKINFVVPTGNFGNILAGYYAKKMGLPINKLIVASNKNNVLTEFFNTGKYDINRQFYKTISPSMDILISSNLERLLLEMLDGDKKALKAIMDELKVYGSYTIDQDIMQEALGDFAAYCTSESNTKDSIDNFFDMYGYLLDTHTGVAVGGYYDYVADTQDSETKTVIVATASPFKFAHDVYLSLTGKDEKDIFKAVKKLESYSGVPIPQQIAELSSLPILHSLVVPKTAIKDTILNLLSKDKEL